MNDGSYVSKQRNYSRTYWDCLRTEAVVFLLKLLRRRRRRPRRSSPEGDCQSGLCRACQFKDPRTVIRHNRYDDIGQRNSSEQSIKLCPVL